MSAIAAKYALAALITALVLSTHVGSLRPTHTQDSCHTFPETAKTICGRFLEYWTRNGGLRQQGLPVSDQTQERSDIDGKTYTVQYFERAVFELHPQNQPPYDVLLSLLGSREYKRRWGKPYWPVQTASTDNPLLFAQTGKTIGGVFRAYWEQNGGLMQQGYPISNEFVERNPVDDKLYTVQYFERAVFELHPEYQPPHNVLLSLLGRYKYDAGHNIAVRPTLPPASQDCLEALKRRGTPIAQGKNSVPTERAKLKTYRVEEVVLPGPMKCPSYMPLEADRYWRVLVSAEGGLVNTQGGNPLWMWVDGVLVGSVGAVEDNYSARTFDLGVLRDGGTISVGPGQADSVSLPETLQFNKVP